MPNNRERGVWFEVVTNHALQETIRLANISGQVYWNQKPSGMTVMPDFIIGKNLDNPEHFILVSAVSSSKNAEIKNWRNIDELFQIKVQAEGHPTATCLFFQSVIKKGLSKVSGKIFDDVLNVQDKPYHRKIESWVTSNFRKKAKSKEDKIALLSQATKVDAELESAIFALATDLAESLKRRNSELNPLWDLMRIDHKDSSSVTTSKPTSVRRGLGKLLVVEPEIRQLLFSGYNKRTGIRADNFPSYVFELGFLKKSLIGAQVSDAEIKDTLDLLGCETCETVLRYAPPSMGTWISPLRDLGRVATHVDFVYQNYEAVANASNLKSLLLTCFEDPAKLSGEPKDEKVWIYEIMISLIKAKSGKFQGYGLAELAADTKVPDFAEGGFIIPPFIQREKMLSRDHLSRLAEGLSERFKHDVSRDDVLALKVKVEDWVIKENLEDRLIPYPNFEPLLWLLILELKKQDKSYEDKKRYGGWINDYADIGKRSATTPFIKVGGTLIHWKSAPKNPRDKTKELSARARNVKYQYDHKINHFSRRAGVRQLALIVDGEWTEEHFETLARSGWDIIVYPDQISQLVEQL